MLKSSFLFFAVCLLAGTAAAGSIYIVEYEYQADISVFVVDYEYQSDVAIYYVEYEYQADLNVFFCEYEYQAEWEETNPWMERMH